jgi:hypothetical protein
MSRLTLSESSLQQQLGAANLELTQSRSDNARLLATKTNLDLQVAELERQMKVAGVTVSKQPIPNPPTSPPPKDDKRGAPADLAYSPQALLKWSRTTLQEHSFGKEGRADLSYEKDGKTHHVRELVIGTLETEYDAKVRPGTSFPVKATFTPHPIMRIPHAADLYAWHLELDYQSSRIKDVQYNTEKSGRKARRREIVLDGPAETWVWELTAPADFQKDRSDIIVYAGYSIPNQEPEMMDITREPVELTEKETPSAFALALAFIKDNLTYILGLISVLVAIWATLISIKKGRLEVKLKEMELAPKA